MAGKEEIIKRLRRTGGKAVIVGIGNELKGDDGAGPLVCEQLVGKTDAEIIDAGSVPENYIQRIIKSKPANLIIIDAVAFGGKAGEIRIFESEELNSLVISTHTLSPKIFIDMIRHEANVDVCFIGIQPAQTQLGREISGEVKKSAKIIADTLKEIFPAQRQSNIA